MSVREERVTSDVVAAAPRQGPVAAVQAVRATVQRRRRRATEQTSAVPGSLQPDGTVIARIGAAVRTHDGPAGRLERLVLGPQTQRVTHLVVRLGWPLSLGRTVVVPVDLVHRQQTDGRQVVLELSDRELHALPGFVEAEYVVSDPSLELPEGYTREQALYRLTQSSALTDAELIGSGLTTQRRQFSVPAGLVSIRRDQPVVCADGPVGTVAQVLGDADSGRMTHFVLRRGGIGPRSFFASNVIVPIAWARVLDDEIFLDVPLEQVDALPEFRPRTPDEQLLLAVEQALRDQPPAGVASGSIRVRVCDGVVDLLGVAPTEEAKRAASRAAAVPGAKHVRNALILPKASLAATVLAVLASDPRTGTAPIEVVERTGTVWLRGTVADLAARDAAWAAAVAVPGVHLVINELRVGTADPATA